MASNFPCSERQGHPLLHVQKLSKHYVRGRGWGKSVVVTAVCDVNFEIRAGQTLALVGASGAGKSTVARCVARLERPDSGEIWLDGTDIARLNSRDLFPIWSNIQMIFQDAETSMNPRFSAAEVIEEPLRIQGASRSERRDIATAVMREVGLPAEWLKRPVLEFSGGQQQRLAIARALSTRPKMLVLDEALSSLDLSTQAQIANLLLDLQSAHSMAYLLISHDLTLAARMADVLSVMSNGRIVEMGATQQVIADPKHAQTQRLLASARAAESKFDLTSGASA
jgi:ABC-type glutathione transport system ATPase component